MSHLLTNTEHYSNMTTTRRVDIIIPVYNEKENFVTTYGLIREHVHSDWRLLLVYDFPEDTTLEAAAPLVAQDERLLLVHNHARGALNAIKTGFTEAQAEAVLVLMVDDPVEIIGRIDALVELFYAEGATIGVASRYMRGGGHHGGPILKGILSRLAGVSLHYVIGLPTHDATYATRVYKKSFLESTRIESTMGFELSLELTLKAYFTGGKIVELPVVWHERTIGTSRFNLRKWLPAYLSWYLWGIAMRYIPFAVKNSSKVASR